MIEETAMKAVPYDMGLAADPGQPAELREAALLGIMAKIFLSQFVIMPTKGDELLRKETEQLFDGHLRMFRHVAEVAAEIIDDPDAGPGVKTSALELKNFFDVFLEAVQVIAEETRETPPPDHVPEPDEENGNGDGNGTFEKPIRAAYLPWPRHRHAVEACCCLPVEAEGCGVVVKEFRGLQLVWRARLITRTIEPWTSRARIIRKIVWVLEWVPVQFIKTISVDCHGQPRIRTKTVRDHTLMTFWRGYEACGAGHHCGGGHHH